MLCAKKGFELLEKMLLQPISQRDDLLAFLSFVATEAIL